MKLFIRLFLLVCFMMLVPTACSPATQGLMQLPDDGRLLVFMLVSAGVTWLLLRLSEFFKVDLSGHTNAVAAAIAPIFVMLIEAGLRLIPPVFDNLVLSIIHLIVLAVGSVGAFFVFRRKAPSLR